MAIDPSKVSVSFQQTTAPQTKQVSGGKDVSTTEMKGLKKANTEGRFKSSAVVKKPIESAKETASAKKAHTSLSINLAEMKPPQGDNVPEPEAQRGAEGKPPEVGEAKPNASPKKVHTGLGINLAQTKPAEVEEARGPMHYRGAATEKPVEAEEVKSKSLLDTVKEKITSSKPATVDPEALKAGVKANEVIRQGARAPESVSAEGYMEAARSLKEHQKADPSITTTMLQLYELSASKLQAEGRLVLATHVRLEAAQVIEFSSSHPLHSMDSAIIEGEKRESNSNFGAANSDLGTAKMPEGVTMHHRKVDDGNGKVSKQNEVSFRLCRLGSHQLQENIKKLVEQHDKSAYADQLDEKGNLDWEKFEGAKLGLSDFGSVEVSKGFFTYLGQDQTKVFSKAKGMGDYQPGYEIEFKNKKGELIGTVSVGRDPSHMLSFNTVHASVAAGVDRGEGLKHMQQMMTILGLGPAMGVRGPDESARSKIALITSVYYPQAWDEVEAREDFYQLSPEDLQATVQEAVKRHGGQGREFEAYASRPELIQEVEVSPGKKMFVLTDLAEKLEKAGCHGVMMGFGTFASMKYTLDGGARSAWCQNEAGIKGGGASREDDAQVNAFDIYARTITDEVSQQKISKKAIIPGKNPGDESTVAMFGECETAEEAIADEAFRFHGKVQILFDLSVLNRGALCYLEDKFGFRNVDYTSPAEGEAFKSHTNPRGTYADRSNMVMFAHRLSQNAKDINKLEYHVQKEKCDKYNELVEQNRLDPSVKVPQTVPVMTRNEKGEPIDAEGNVKKSPIHNALNEVCIPGGCIGPEYINGLMVQDEQTKGELIQFFKKNGMIKEPVMQDGKIVDGILVFGKGIEVPLDKFIHVGDQFKKEMWKKPTK